MTSHVVGEVHQGRCRVQTMALAQWLSPRLNSGRFWVQVPLAGRFLWVPLKYSNWISLFLDDRLFFGVYESDQIEAREFIKGTGLKLLKIS